MLTPLLLLLLLNKQSTNMSFFKEAEGFHILKQNKNFWNLLNQDNFTIKVPDRSLDRKLKVLPWPVHHSLRQQIVTLKNYVLNHLRLSPQVRKAK